MKNSHQLFGFRSLAALFAMLNVFFICSGRPDTCDAERLNTGYLSRKAAKVTKDNGLSLLTPYGKEFIKSM